VQPTDHNANIASKSKAGFVAMRRSSCPPSIRPSRSPACIEQPRSSGLTSVKPSRSLLPHSKAAVFSLCGLVLACLAFTVAPALAATPIILTESTSPTAKPSEEVRLEATVNAGEEAAPKATECHFQYGKTSVTEHEEVCEQGNALEGGEQGVAVTVAGLQAGTTYDYRVVLKNASGKQEGGEEKVTTLPVPSTEVPSPIGATTATFKGKLTPFNSTFPAEYYFVYIVGEEAFCLNEHETGRETASAEAVSTKVTELEPNEKYTVCLLSTNTLGDIEEDLTPKYFETEAAVPTVETQSTSAVTPFAAHLEATVNADNQEVTKCEFEYGTNASLATPKTVPCEQATLPGIYGGQVATASVSGLTPDVTYYYRVLATNATGASKGTAIESFPTLTAEKPVVEPGSEKISEVGAKDVKLQAQVNPNYQTTTYAFEYATSGAAVLDGEGTKVAGGSLPAGFGAQTAGPVDLGGALQPSAAYYYRIVATNGSGATSGEVEAFTTFPPSESVLPDDRAYELVSQFPHGTDEEAYVPPVLFSYIREEENGIKTALPFRVSRDGEAVVYPGDPPPTGGSGSRGITHGNEYLASRTSAGWGASDIQPPTREPQGAIYEAFSSDLSVGVLLSNESELGGGTKAYKDFYTHATVGGAGGEYDPSYTGSPLNRTANEWITRSAGGNAGTGAVPAFSHFLFEANDALPTLNLAPAGGGGEDPASHLPFRSEKNLYDSAGGGLYLVNVLPNDTTEANASFGQPGGGGSNVVSADGSRIFWTALEGLGESRIPKALYVRENDTSPDASTVLVAEGGEFWAANSEGSLVFYTKEGDLYSFDVETRQTTVLSVPLNPSEKAEVQGVLGVSNGGSYVYFAADAVLAGENAEGKKPISSEPNLYLSHEGSTTFIATLSLEDGSAAPPFQSPQPRIDSGDWRVPGGYRTAEVTPDGHSLVFMSNERLTGYDNEQILTGLTLDEVFRYEAPSGARAGKLTCVSCNPSGEQPGLTELNTDYTGLPIGGFIPVSRSEAGEQPRVISEDGDQVFFDSGEPLLPTATNGWVNVYEWERAGTPDGSCPEGAPGGGCVYLLSSGTDPENSYLLGAGVSGTNAFFVSRAQLVPADRGNDGDVVYDARVGGMQAQAEAACSGTGCQGVPPTPPIFATPSSVTFNGVGNFPPSAPPKVVVRSLTRAQKLAKALKTCRQDKSKKKRIACEKSAQKRYGPAKKAKKSSKAKRAGNDRRADS